MCVTFIYLFITYGSFNDAASGSALNPLTAVSSSCELTDCQQQQL
jgi:hypothetical protein